VTSGTLIRQGITEKGMTLREAAAQIYYSEETMYAVCKNRRKVPKDARPRLSRLSPKAALALAEEDTGYVIPVTYLDRIDRHPQASAEVINILGKLQGRLLNKRCGDELSEEVKVLLCDVVFELYDLSVGIMNFLPEMENFGADLPDISSRHMKKLIESGYKSPPEKKRAAR